MKKQFVLFLIFVLTAIIILSCALLQSLNNPKDFVQTVANTAKPIAEAAKPIENQEEYYIGREVAAIILSNYNLYDDKKLEEYLNLVCMSLVVNSEMPEIYNGYHVAILDTDEINALSTSGGHILVSRGLLSCAKSEDSLAGVLAHELGHIQLKHGVKAIKADRLTHASIKSIGVATDSDSSSNMEFLKEASTEIVTTMVNSGYSKTQEFDADKFAVRLMAKTGYDPNAMCELLEIMQEKQKNDRRGFGKTHPSASLRIKNLKREVAKLTGQYNREERKKRYARYYSN